MRYQKLSHARVHLSNRALQNILSVVLISAMLVGCIPQLGGSGEIGSIEQTQMELSVQQTLMAQKATQNFLSQQNQQVDLGMQATQTVLAAQNLAAQQAMQATETSYAATLQSQQQPPSDQPVQSQAPVDETTQEPAPPSSDGEFETYMENARILLYEDMVNDPTTKRYVKAALDNLGLDYKDDGSAKGWLKSDLLSGGWDLIIISLEWLNVTPTGEYFIYLNQAMEQGSAIILETWFLCLISEGEIFNLLSKCGIEYEKDYLARDYTLEEFIVWPLPDKGTHPILNEPNSGFSWTNVTSFWLGDNELGDYIRLNGKKPDAQLLLGTMAMEKNTHGTLAVGCNGKFIIQTFLSHSYAQKESIALWENYIYNALKAKWLESQQG